MGGALTNPDGVTGEAHIHTKGNARIDLSTRWQHLVFAKPDFANGASADAARWADLLSRIDRVRGRLLGIDRPPTYWEGILLVSRAALILADHKVSSRTFNAAREDGILYANTKKASVLEEPATRRGRRTRTPASPSRFLDQPLSWHLTEVGTHAAANVRMFTADDLPTVDRDLVQAVLQSRAAPGSRFAWQDVAVDAVSQLDGGKLIFNVASTGAGKTLANLKIAFAMRAQAARLAVAFNLRSLTTQTFDAFGRHIKAIDRAAFARNFACLLGERGALQRDFSREDEDDVAFEDDLDLISAEHPIPDWLAHIAQDAKSSDKLAKLIVSPVLVSTMDWIVAAGEPGQQDRHAKALIRVAGSDLILDEVDSYDVRATVAVMRVVQTAAAFGRNVIVSSATLSPALARGLAAAYAAGRRVQDALFGAQPWSLVMTSDRFAPQVLRTPSESEADQFYRNTMRSMCSALRAAPATKRYRLADVQTLAEFSSVIAEQATVLHAMHAAVPAGLACRLSIGLVRVANVSTCMAVSEALRQDGRFVVSAYHARDIAERRAWKERHLDRILARGDDSWVRALLDVAPWIQDAKGDVRLVVVATPVEEVGRDHDFDWAIIEPSSMHSIIQTAGRVNRHRMTPMAERMHNVVLLTRNLKSLHNPQGACFQRPGLEILDASANFRTHRSHDLKDLMLPESGQAASDVLDASLVFDEHGRQTAFAKDDERAIETTLGQVRPILQRDTGYAMHFMLKAYASKFPLRDGGISLQYEVDLQHQAFYLAGQNRKEGDALWRGAPNTGDKRVWLCPDVSDLEGDEKRLHFEFKRTTMPENRKKAGAPFRVELLWNGIETFDEN
jgi:CRISPR-associated endonuclease/helicase Cas3